MIGQLGRLGFAAAEPTTGNVRGSFTASSARSFSFANNRQSSQTFQFGLSPAASSRLALQASAVRSDVDTRNLNAARKREHAPELQVLQGFPEANGTLPAALYRLVDPAAPVDLPPPGAVKLTAADNRELDKLVAALGRNKVTWRRALVLHEWLLSTGHKSDDRLCTTLIRVCAQHGQAAAALALYDWMRLPVAEGGAGLRCTVYTYTAAMRAALMGNMLDRAMEVWEHAEADHPNEIDCRLCSTLIDVCARRGDTDQALETYRRMRAAPGDSKMAPTVHTYTAAMRAAAEGGRPNAALAIWDDMRAAGCKPNGHAYSAAISACAAGGEWQRAVALFDEMLGWGVKPDVVSCTALVTALGADGQWERAEKVVEWMLRNDIRPNVRTYTALVGALANARQWDRATAVVKRMKAHALGAGVEPNAYTYSALLKAMGDHGKWQMAEALFNELEAEALAESRSHQQQQQQIEDASGAAREGNARAGSAGAGPGTGVEEAEDTSESLEERIAADLLVARTAELALRGEGDDTSNPSGAPSSATGVVGTCVGNAVPASMPAFSYFSSASAHKRSGGSGSPSSAQPEPASPTGTAAASPSHSPKSIVAAEAASVPLGPGQQEKGSSSVWTTNNAASKGLQLDLESALHVELERIDVDSLSTASSASLQQQSASAAAVASRSTLLPLTAAKGSSARSVLNEVVCGALMMAYERAGMWKEAVAVLDRTRTLGIAPNTVMYNIAVSALGKAGQMEAARAMFDACPCPDAVSYETLTAAYGIAGLPEAAEALVAEMRGKGYSPRDYAYCGLVAAYSMQGNLRAALRVKDRAAADGLPPTVFLYNALIAACDRSHQYTKAVALGREMSTVGVAPNAMTKDLLDGVCQGGMRAIENQQAAVAALSAAVAAAGTVMMRVGVF